MKRSLRKAVPLLRKTMPPLGLDFTRPSHLEDYILFGNSNRLFHKSKKSRAAFHKAALGWGLKHGGLHGRRGGGIRGKSAPMGKPVTCRNWLWCYVAQVSITQRARARLLHMRCELMLAVWFGATICVHKISPRRELVLDSRPNGAGSIGKDR